MSEVINYSFFEIKKGRKKEVVKATGIKALNDYCRHLFLVSVAEVLQVTGRPVLVSPDAPAGVQKAPAVTSFTTCKVALGVGEAVVASGVGEGEVVASAVGVAETVGFAIATPLFQTNLPLLLTQVYLTPPLILEAFSGLHAVPLLIAPNAEVGNRSKPTNAATKKTFFILLNHQLPLF